MRQAILITAYKNEKQIYDIISLLGKEFDFYIHIDKKSPMSLDEVQGKGNIHIFKKYIVNWGSVNHLKAILFLSKKALENNSVGYFHLVTGQDFPVQTKNYFTNELDTNKDYLEYFEMPAKCWDNGGMYRLEYYNCYEFFNAKTALGRLKIDFLLKVQKILKIKRKIPYEKFKKLYGGSTYWSLKRDTLQYVLNFTENNNDFFKRMNFTFCSEEIYFQTILLNSKFRDNIINDSLRYIDWSSGRGGYPAFLDITDYEKIISSNKIFARKFHEEKSEELKNRLLKKMTDEIRSTNASS